MSKPVVSIAVGPEIFKKMFRVKDLDRLHLIARVLGPLPAAAELEDYRSMIEEADVVITGWGTIRLTSALIASAPNLKLIAHSAGSVKALVDDSAFDRGIKVTTAASANAVAVAQYTISMMTALLKQIPWIGVAYAKGDHDDLKRRRPAIRELMDMDVGIVGASRVGRDVIKMLKTYPNLNIKCYDPYLPADLAKELGVEMVSFQEVCRCELVSIHAPNTTETYRMFNARALSLLPDHAVLINTSRGALIDEDALVSEVKKRPIYVCLDVTDPEPPKADSPLRNTNNILLTPHVAGAMRQACADMGELAVTETIRFLSGHKLHHEVTREMLPTQA